MNKYEKLFNKIEIEGSLECEQIAGEILSQLEKQLGFNLDCGSLFKNATGMVNTNKIIYLLTIDECRPYLMPLLEEYGYNQDMEYLCLLFNACLHGDKSIMFRLPCLISYEKIENGYIMNTKVGKITVYRADLVFPEIKEYSKYTECHNGSYELVRDFENVSASTCLLSWPFGGLKHYHSFINFDGDVIDLANNLCMRREEYDLVLHPQVINTVTHAELAAEVKRIDNKENLGKGKALLLRLALDKQIK